ncbi:MAG: hypothetical protein PHN90_07925 [Methanothrix sp.]|jgi:hypothetical protein|nr:hypothetical protein [Methanothrix sp.]OPX81999.1 MAG: hypothetical protein A4E50_00639 [Methanosaeta sp. PtaB.Bin087]HNT72301.1 hypothetical protein [Methanothrix sp.]HOI68631.1 hypothetical protein [Methanothrix sp.]HPY71615.1 hypothetical protein [Methanothrix sp.]
MKKTDLLPAAHLGLILLLAASPYSSALPTLPSGKENPLPLLYPELESLPAPPWVVEGLRATYYATVDGGTTAGKSSAGEALIQIDLVALEGRSAATSTSVYLRGPLGSLRPLTGAGHGAIVPAGLGDFWASPEVLAEATEGADDRVTIIRGPVEVAGKNYQGIRFEVTHQGLRYSMTYDEETGLLLHHRYDILSADGSAVETGIIDFRKLRQLVIPWAGGSSPGWLRPGLTMTYRGQTVFEIPGTAPSPFALTLTAEVVSKGAKSSIVRWSDAGDSGLLIPARSAAGVYQLMGFWLPDAALAIDDGGNVDSDPDTGMMITVIQNDQNGVVFEETNGQDYRRLLTYDKATGKLVTSYEEQLTEAMTGTVQKTWLELAI